MKAHVGAGLVSVLAFLGVGMFATTTDADGRFSFGFLRAWLESPGACDASPADAIERRVASSL